MRKAGAIVAFGGSNASTCFDDTLIIRPTAGSKQAEWSTTSGPGPCGRRGHTLTPLDDNRLLLFGGTTRTASFNDLYLFDAGKMRWLPVVGVTGDLPSPRAFHSAVIVNKVLVVTGGTNGDPGAGGSLL